MKLAVTLAALIALTLGADARAIDYTNWPNSVQPVFISQYEFRFSTNIATGDWNGEEWIAQGAGGNWGIWRATPTQAAAPAVPAPSGETLEFENPYGRSTLLYIVDAAGHKQLIDSEAYAPAGAAISPDGTTVVFAQWVGWTYGDSSVLYAARTDGSSAPVRVTPTFCGFKSNAPGSLRGHCVQGSDDADRITGTKYGDLVIAGAGDDVIHAGDGQNEIQAQWGNDTITTGSGHDEVWGGAGNDVISTGAGSDLVIPGTGRDSVNTGRGADYVYANDGERDVVNCGPGIDGVVADQSDVLRNCEHVWLRPPFIGWPVPR